MNSSHSLESWPRPELLSAIEQAFNQQASKQLNNDFDEGVGQHGRIMALSDRFVKQGNFETLFLSRQSFPAWQTLRVC